MKNRIIYKSLVIAWLAMTINAHAQTPYELLHLSVSAGEKQLTVPFVGLDYNYSAINFSAFLQDIMSLNSENFEVKPNQLIETFSRKYGYDQIKVTYNIIKKKGIIGYGETNSGEIALIESVVIVGATDLIIDIYIKYWDTNFKREDFHVNDLASRHYWGDKITISYLSAKEMKITIKPEGDFQYEKNFGIHQKRE